MASLKERLTEDMKTAMREKDTARRDTVRLLVSEVKKKEIDLGHGLHAAEELQLLQSQAKQRRDSIEQFRQGGREDLVAREQAQLEVIESYLPQQMTDEELDEFIGEGIAQSGAQDPKDMGKLMGLLSKSSGGRVEGRRLSDAVRHRLTQFASDRGTIDKEGGPVGG
ncbi:MAG TPA: GatB/YqeY domain-containing protein [Thermomicrobiales bacterium]|nr:GatB/YqeY domain-containing protein [Thermomicrobiales bacterium]